MNDKFFGNIEKKTGVRMGDVFALVDSLQYADFKDERTIRAVVAQTAALAGKKVPKPVEDEIVRTILKDGKKLDIDTITKMIK
ncbi:stage VI sporulation protein F [Domibacillus sp. PGB-M46]|uniref:stage VI sporulation protein F n=1 Tax=Domibacillus sp. PGB-M46 TaxID=2910255 RepID=UPI001F5618C0|nr:stage VI sporulation protein F [Domibacillus sp. PGB-M46]MCI2255781.1 stage VI sporulation protein F [Domibacillus sp. PGB-M46]